MYVDIRPNAYYPRFGQSLRDHLPVAREQLQGMEKPCRSVCNMPLSIYVTGTTKKHFGNCPLEVRGGGVVIMSQEKKK